MMMMLNRMEGIAENGSVAQAEEERVTAFITLRCAHGKEVGRKSCGSYQDSSLRW